MALTANTMPARPIKSQASVIYAINFAKCMYYSSIKASIDAGNRRSFVPTYLAFPANKRAIAAIVVNLNILTMFE